MFSAVLRERSVVADVRRVRGLRQGTDDEGNVSAWELEGCWRWAIQEDCLVFFSPM